MGEHSAVVWNRLYLSPFAARRSAVGVLTGPPKALLAAKPTSSRRTTRTFGAPVRRSDVADRRIRGVRVLGVVGREPDMRLVGDRQDRSADLAHGVPQEHDGRVGAALGRARQWPIDCTAAH